MARPPKSGVDYFPLDVHLDEKFELLEAQFGLKAFAIVVKLFQKIYGGEGYYCEWNEDIALLFAKKNKVNHNVVSDIINAAVKRGIFDEKMYHSYGILTSKGIQKQYIKAVTKRKQIEIIEAYWLIPYTKNSVTSDENGVNDGINPENDTNNTHTKENNIIPKNTILNDKETEKKEYGNYSHVLLSDQEYAMLEDEYGSKTQKLIDYLDEKMEQYGYKYNNCYLAITKQWAQIYEDERMKKQKVKPGPLNNFNQERPDFEEVERIALEKLKNF